MEEYCSALGYSVYSNATDDRDMLTVQQVISQHDDELERWSRDENHHEVATNFLKGVLIVLYGSPAIKEAVLSIPSKECWETPLPIIMQRMFAELQGNSNLNVHASEILDCVPQFWLMRAPVSPVYFLEKIVQIIYHESRINLSLSAKIQRLFFNHIEKGGKFPFVIPCWKYVLETGFSSRQYNKLPYTVFVDLQDSESYTFSIREKLDLSYECQAPQECFVLFAVLRRDVHGQPIVYIQPHLDEWKQLVNGSLVSVPKEEVLNDPSSAVLLAYEKKVLLAGRDKVPSIAWAGDICVGSCGATWVCQSIKEVLSSPCFSLFGCIWQLTLNLPHSLRLEKQSAHGTEERFSEVTCCLYTRSAGQQFTMSSSVVVENDILSDTRCMKWNISGVMTIGQDLIVQVKIKRPPCGPISGLQLGLLKAYLANVGADVTLQAHLHSYKICSSFVRARCPAFFKHASDVAANVSKRTMNLVLLYLHTAQLPALSEVNAGYLHNAATKLKLVDLMEAQNLCKSVSTRSKSEKSLEWRSAARDGSSLLECTALDTVLWCITGQDSSTRKESPPFTMDGRGWEMCYVNDWLTMEEAGPNTNVSISVEFCVIAEGKVVTWGAETSKRLVAFTCKRINTSCITFMVYVKRESGFQTGLAASLNKKLLSDVGSMHSLGGGDVNISGCDGSIKAHRCILAACSLYFMRMFQTDMKELSAETVETVFTVQALDDMKRYMYCRELPCNERDLQALMEVADYFLMNDLLQMCAEKLKEL